MIEPDGQVLLVEDDDDLRTTIVHLLHDDGIDVAEAANGLEALQWIGEHGRPRVILLDLMMPKMDGVEFRKAQLALPELVDVPVVLMTASTMHQPLLDASGVDAVLRKPVEYEVLLATVRRYL